MSLPPLQPADHSDAISEIQRLRVAATKNTDRSEASLEALQRYYDQLVALEQKIPASEVRTGLLLYSWSQPSSSRSRSPSSGRTPSTRALYSAGGCH